MPFASKKQLRFMFSQKPAMAKRWAKETPDIKGLPESVGKMTVQGMPEIHGMLLIGKADGSFDEPDEELENLIGKAVGQAPTYPYGTQTLPDYQYIYSIRPTPEQEKQDAESENTRRTALAGVNRNRFGFHGSPPKPVLKNEAGMYSNYEPQTPSKMATKPLILPPVIFKRKPQEQRERLTRQRNDEDTDGRD